MNYQTFELIEIALLQLEGKSFAYDGIVIGTVNSDNPKNYSVEFRSAIDDHVIGIFSGPADAKIKAMVIS